MNKATFTILATLLFVVQGAWADKIVTNESELRFAVQENQTVTLSNDITLNNSHLAIRGMTVTLDLNGHTLSRSMTAAASGGHVICIMADEYDKGALTITDSGSGGMITGGWAYEGGGIYVSEGCSLTINGGTITGNRAGEFGGGIHNEGTLNITGGSITNNTAGQYGGGIYSNSTVSISGATISGNTAQTGGRAISSEGMLTLDGITIQGNRAQRGGGIYMFKSETSPGTVQLQGACTITGNIAQAGGGIIQSTNGNAEGPTLRASISTKVRKSS